jgi:hypothetical protein
VGPRAVLDAMVKRKIPDDDDDDVELSFYVNSMCFFCSYH